MSTAANAVSSLLSRLAGLSGPLCRPSQFSAGCLLQLKRPKQANARAIVWMPMCYLPCNCVVLASIAAACRLCAKSVLSYAFPPSRHPRVSTVHPADSGPASCPLRRKFETKHLPNFPSTQQSSFLLILTLHLVAHHAGCKILLGESQTHRRREARRWRPPSARSLRRLRTGHGHRRIGAAKASPTWPSYADDCHRYVCTPSPMIQGCDTTVFRRRKRLTHPHVCPWQAARSARGCLSALEVH